MLIEEHLDNNKKKKEAKDKPHLKTSHCYPFGLFPSINF